MLDHLNQLPLDGQFGFAYKKRFKKIDFILFFLMFLDNFDVLI
jgi:hypothetical protein